MVVGECQSNTSRYIRSFNMKPVQPFAPFDLVMLCCKVMTATTTHDWGVLHHLHTQPSLLLPHTQSLPARPQAGVLVGRRTLRRRPDCWQREDVWPEYRRSRRRDNGWRMRGECWTQLLLYLTHWQLLFFGFFVDFFSRQNKTFEVVDLGKCDRFFVILANETQHNVNKATEVKIRCRSGW